MRDFKLQHQERVIFSKEDAIERLLSGKAQWNAWAIAMGAEKQALIDEGRWDAERIWSAEHQAIITVGENKATQGWLDRALIDFAHLIFTSDAIEYKHSVSEDHSKEHLENTTYVTFPGDEIDFNHLIFPSDVLFRHSRFKEQVSFKEVMVEGDAWFEDATFDHYANFSKINFEGEAWFNRANFLGEVSFKAAHFAQGAWFNKARFAKKAQFSQIICSSTAWFYDAHFKGRAIFNDATFHGDAAMEDLTFKGRVFFKAASFEKDASFKETTFNSRALFQACIFGKGAFFNHCDFNGYTIFDKTVFKAVANFKAIHCQRGFNLEHAVFETEIPNFHQAHLEVPAQLANITLLPPPKRQKFSRRVKTVLKGMRRTNRFQRKVALLDITTTEWLGKCYTYYENRFMNARRKSTDEVYYKSLKRLANDANNLAAQKMFHAGEIRSRRHIKDRWKDFPHGSLSYLKGVLDEMTSDFGRSITRPVFCWGLAFLLFTGAYLGQSIDPLAKSCDNKYDLSPHFSPLSAAQYISIHNALGVGWIAPHNMTLAKSCLYGKVAQTKKNKDQARLAYLDGEIITGALPTPIKANTPLSMKLTTGLQTGLSFLFFSLFLVSMRNRLRMSARR